MPKAAPPPPPEDDNLDIVDLRKALEERYLSYALSTITQRALPDVRDGLKPVHRRIIHVMRLLRLDPSEAYKKSAKVVGDVIGGFHPHGDQSIYDAMVRLAQDFSMRYPLVDGQGNFGNIDGDGPAAYRYTEAKMTDIAMRLLEGMNEDAVDFKPTYDGTLEEPVVLPANFPNLLANGSTGIAVGMATSIPPHNVAELCNAALKLIGNPETPVEDLLHHDFAVAMSPDDLVRGPDFPTGGVLVEPRASIVEAYRTGRGSFRVRARWHKEDKGRGVYHIVVTEIPYGVAKGKLIEKVAELILAKKLPLLKDIRDESADDVRVVLEPRAGTVDATILMEHMFKLSDLEQRIPLNMNVLDMGVVPRVMNLKQVLSAWLEHRKDVLVRRTQHRLDQIARRLEILDGYIVAYLNLDEVIRIIREEDDAKAELIRAFSLTDNQAEAVLNMRLRSLRKLEEMELRSEHQKLTTEQGQLETLLGSDKKQWGEITTQITELKKVYGKDTVLGRRKTEFGAPPDAEVSIETATAFIEREPITVILSEKGWIRAMKGHAAEIDDKGFKTGDRLKFAFHAETTDKLLLLSTGGKVYTIAPDKLPGGRGQGEPLRLMVDVEEGQDFVDLFVHTPGSKRLIASSGGNGFVVAEDDLIANTRKGKQVLNVSGTDEAKLIVPAAGDTVAIIGENRKMLIFAMSELPEMSRGKGVRLQKYKDGGISDARIFAAAEGLTWVDSSGRSFNKSMAELQDWVGERAQAGRQPPTGFPRNNKFG
jgi:topoisomerase-4 subunit A